MKKGYLTALEIGFFALALFWFISVIHSIPSPYGYFPEALLVLVAISISRLFSYKNGRSIVLCVLEVAIMLVVFLVHRFALNTAVGF